MHPSIDNYQQELSMEGQRRDIERFVDEHAYEIVRWYEDDGVSHDATNKRVGFRQLHHDATNGPLNRDGQHR